MRTNDTMKWYKALKLRTNFWKLLFQHKTKYLLRICVHFLYSQVYRQIQFSKQQKLQKKKEERERQQTVTNLLRDLLKYQDILNVLGNDDVRPDFLAGTKGAVVISATLFMP